jgi:hypothetical protein
LCRNSLLKHVIGEIEGMRRCKKQVDYFKEKRRYRNLKEKALEYIVLENLLLRQTTT